MLRRNFTFLSIASKRPKMTTAISALPEMVQREKLLKRLKEPDLANRVPQTRIDFSSLIASDPHEYSVDRARMIVDASLLTFAVHVESRVASLLGEGFYTIGPCGEELTSVLGVLLASTDPMALHYRHVAANIARQLKNGESIDVIALNRARGYCVSKLDPVTAGAHCALGGGSHDFMVTSTLASQSSPALGRALGGVLGNHIGIKTPFPKDFVSFFSLGDGSIHNGHFLSANNMAEFAAFRGTRVPLLTCISDNGLSISFRTHDYLKKQFSKKLQQPVFVACGDDVGHLWKTSKEAIDYCRSKGRPATLVIGGLTRRFGHAATDRQSAYMDACEVANRAETDVLVGLCAQMVRSGVFTQREIADRFESLSQLVASSFEKASEEPKLTSRQDLVSRVSAPLVPMPDGYALKSIGRNAHGNVWDGVDGVTGAKAQVMRKHMTHVFDELMSSNANMVYVGEDVRHGGYYLVTEGLAKKYNARVHDFPPDETSIIGIGMGMAHSGLLPVIEMPYAKYLDCGLDMFAEAALMHWLSDGKQPNGMLVRLQGFGRGVFGGNFHTHNMLHMPPGVDVVCYSNGADYASGIRFAIEQVKRGRMVMSVDATELLNLREVLPGRSWEFAYTDSKEYLTFDSVFLYRCPGVKERLNFAIVTFGNGVIASLQAQTDLVAENVSVDVIDCPLLSEVPQGLREAVAEYEYVLFADVCKEGSSPLASHMASLMNGGAFKKNAVIRCVAAPKTYNPLGNTLTFLNKEDIVTKVMAMKN